MGQFKNNRSVEQILVAKNNQVLINDVANGATLPSGSAASANTPLMNSNGTVNLSAGQLGIFDNTGFGTVAQNAAIAVGNTITNSPEIYIAQGTAQSQTPGVGNYPLTNNRPYEKSSPIIGANSVIYTAKVCAMPTFSTWEVSGVNVASSTEYAVKIAFRGRRQDEQNSTHGTSSINPNFVTPDYTIVTSIVNGTDHVLKNIAYQINRSSRAFNVSRPSFGARMPVVAFAVDSTGAATGVAISALTVGTVLNVFISGNQKTLTITPEILNTLTVGLGASEKIVNINLTTAGTLVAGADKLVIMALDEELAFKDKIAQKKIRLDVGLSRGFDVAATAVQVVKPYEGEGQSRQWQLYYEATSGQRKYAQYSQLYPVIEYPTDIVENEVYTAFIIEHFRNDQISFAETTQAGYKTIVLVPCCDSDTIDSFRRIFEPWLTSCDGRFRDVPSSFSCPGVYA